MNKTLAAAGLALVLLLSAACGAESLLILNNDLYLSNVPAGMTVTNAFAVSNSSASAATVSSVRPTCGCTFASASTDVIQPGTVAFVRFGFKAGDRQGWVSKKIILELSRGPSDEQATAPEIYYLTFNARVVDLFSVSVDKVVLRAKTRSALKTARAECLIIPVRQCRDLVLQSLTPADARLKASWAQLPDGSVRVVVAADTAKPGTLTFDSSFTAVLSCDGISRTYQVPVSVITGKGGSGAKR